MVWEGSDHLGKSSSIFTSVMFEGYKPPRGFDWDMLGWIYPNGNDVIRDDPKSNDYNVDEMVKCLMLASNCLLKCNTIVL